MANTLRILRSELAAELADRTFARLAWLRGEDDGSDPQDTRRTDFFTSDQVLEALDDVSSRDQVGPADLAALRTHVALARMAVQDGPQARQLLLGSLGQRGGQPPLRLAAQLERTLHLSHGGVRPRQLAEVLAMLQAAVPRQLTWLSVAPARLVAEGGQPASSELAQRAEAVLAATEGPFMELLEYEGRRHGGRSGMRFDTVLCTLRGSHLDGLFKLSSRLRRVATPLRELGFERLMGHRMRGEIDDRRLLPFADVQCAGDSDQVRVLHSGHTAGPLGELSAMQAAARGLVIALAATELPFEQRLPLPMHASQAFGGLYMQAGLHPLYLRRYYGLSGRELEDARRGLLVSYLFWLRLHAQLFSWANNAIGEADLAERALSALRGALCVDCEPSALGLLVGLAPDHGGTLSGMLSGLRLHVGLRERFDEDYFRNPRLAEVVAGAGAQGNHVTTDGLQEDLGLEPGWDVARLEECF